MSKKNKMTVYYGDEWSEGRLFFKGDECVGYISGNDADWRHEYFDPIVKLFGLEVESLDKLNKKQLKSAKDQYGEYYFD